MPKSLPKITIFIQLVKSWLAHSLTALRAAFLIALWGIAFPVSVRLSLWFPMRIVDYLLTSQSIPNDMFTEKAANSNSTSFAKYFLPALNETEAYDGPPSELHVALNKYFPINLRGFVVRNIEGFSLVVAYLLLAFVVLMVREWIVMHELPLQDREAAAAAAAEAFQARANALNAQNGLNNQQPPQERLPQGADQGEFAEHMNLMREILLQHQAAHEDALNNAGPNAPEQEAPQVFGPPRPPNNEGPGDEPVFINGIPLLNEELHIDLDPEEEGRGFGGGRPVPQEPEAEVDVGPFADPDFVLDDDDEADGEPIDEIEGIMQLIGVGVPFRTILLNFAWVATAATAMNVCLVVLPFAIGRIAVAAIGLFAAQAAHFLAHMGNNVLDSILLVLSKTLGTSVGTVTETSIKEIFARPMDLTYLKLVWSYVNSPHPKSFHDGLAHVMFGVFLFVMACIAYINSQVRFATTAQGVQFEHGLIRIFRHVGDILKVMTVSGIELVVFPVFCGVLITAALLPLLPNQTFKDCVLYTLNHPFDSPLIYWMLGTFYMVNLAMFVTVCREQIMRRGVLYFVRDPNEPNFHPVKEIMERKLLSQLRKIAISGVMYAILICVCIGGIVWPMRYVFHVSFLPVTVDVQVLRYLWPSNNPFMILIWPFTFFLARISLPHFHPVAIGQRVWEAVFLQVCGKLRLSSFILNRPIPYERGTVYYGSLMAWFSDVKPDFTKPGRLEDVKNLPHDKALFVLDGTFVRAPAADNAAIKQDLKLFIEVDKDDVRADGQENGPKDLQNYTVVYCPPRFRWRIFGLLCAIWAVGAAVVFSCTGLPIIIGRFLLSFSFTPKQIDENNLFAFVIGILPTILVVTAVDQRDKLMNAGAKLLQDFSNFTNQGALFVGIALIKVIAFFLLYFIVLPLAFLGTLHKFVSEPLGLSFKDSLPVTWLLANTFLIFVAIDVRFTHPNFFMSIMLNKILRNGITDLDPGAVFRGYLQIVMVSIVLHIMPQFFHHFGGYLVDRGWKFSIFLSMRDYSYICGITAMVGAVITSLMEHLWQQWENSARDEVYLVASELENL